MVKYHYVLIASGNIGMRQLDIPIRESNIEFARADCELIAATLSKAGYYRFHLYQTEGEIQSETAKYVGHFTTRHVEPEVKFYDN